MSFASLTKHVYPIRASVLDIQYYPFPAICGFLIDNTGSLLLTTQKLQKVTGNIYFFRGYQKMQKISEIFEELSSADAFRTQILAVCGKRHCMSHWQQHRLTGS